MERLGRLLEGLEYTLVQGQAETEITGLAYDSRKVTEGCLFVCIKGAVADGHDFIDEVAKKGAAAIMVQEEADAPEGVALVRVADTRYGLALASAAWFGHPARELKVIGVTGTKGKGWCHRGGTCP